MSERFSQFVLGQAPASLPLAAQQVPVIENGVIKRAPASAFVTWGGSGSIVSGNIAVGGSDANQVSDSGISISMAGSTDNLFLGVGAGNPSVTGILNTAVGFDAGNAITAGGSLTLFGYRAGATMTTDTTSVCVGDRAGAMLQGRSNNTVLGSNALADGDSPNNTLIGERAGVQMTGGINLAIGVWAGVSITSGQHNIVIGPNLPCSTTLATGSRNIVIGTDSNADTPASDTNDTIVVAASSGATPWVTGSLAAGALTAKFGGGVYTNEASAILHSTATITNGAGSSTGTLTNAPSAGNPSKWLPYDDHGTTRMIPAW